MPWRPAVAAVDNGYSADASGVVPRIDGFGPWPGPVQATVALASNACGAATLFDDQNAPTTFAGTTTNLYRLVSGTPATWTDVSGSVYSCDPTQRWQWAPYGTQAIAVNLANAPQTALFSGGSFSNLGGSPPRAKFIRVVGDQVVLGHLSTNARVLHWSGINDATQWTVGVNSCDVQEFADGGAITGLGGAVNGIVFQETCIRRMVFTPQSPDIYQIDKIASDRGCAAPYGVVNVADASMFPSRDGFWLVDGGQFTPIGAGKIDQWFFDQAPIDKLTYCEGAIDPIRHRAYWSFYTAAAVSNADHMLCYDWVLQEWSHAAISSRCLLSYVNPSYTLEQLDAFGTLDTLPYSLDSSYWVGKLRNPGYVGADNILYTMSGASLAALVEMADFQPIPGKRTFVSGATLDIDSAAATLQVGVRERLPDAVSWGSEITMESTGAAAAHSEGRYVRARIRVPAGQTWTSLTGLTPDVAPAGNR